MFSVSQLSPALQTQPVPLLQVCVGAQEQKLLRCVAQNTLSKVIFTISCSQKRTSFILFSIWVPTNIISMSS